MAEFQLKEIIRMSQAEFWPIFYSEKFDQYVCGRLGFPNVSTLEFTDQGDYTLKRVKVVPNVPESIRKILAAILRESDFFYVDNQKKYKQGFRVQFKTEPPVLHNSIDTGGEVVIEAAGPDSCYYIMRGWLRINIFGIGKLLEKLIIGELEKSFRKVPPIINEGREYLLGKL